MKLQKRLTAITLFLTAFFLCACASMEIEANGYDLYFQESDLNLAAGGGALQTEHIYLTATEDPRALAETLMSELLKGPRDETLKNTIPAGTTLQSLELTGRRAVVDLSAAYSNLSGIALTMADYAITLTLTQIPEILAVQITVRGQELTYREKQVFLNREALLSQEEDVLRTIPATLYFLNSDGVLTPEERLLELYEGDTQVSAAAKALERGPENQNLSPVLPEGFQLNAVWQEDDICYVNLSAAQMENGTENLQAAIQSLGRSMCSLESVNETWFLVDGEFSDEFAPISAEKFSSISS